MSTAVTYEAIVGDRRARISIDQNRVFIDDQEIHFTVDARSDRVLSVVVDGRPHEIVVEDRQNGRYTLLVDNQRLSIRIKSRREMLLERYGIEDAAHTGPREVHAPMPGLVLDVFISDGDAVEKGQPLLVLEAMKMENEIRAASAGTVRRVHVRTGEAVGKNDLLVELGV